MKPEKDVVMMHLEEAVAMIHWRDGRRPAPAGGYDDAQAARAYALVCLAAMYAKASLDMERSPNDTRAAAVSAITETTARVLAVIDPAVAESKREFFADLEEMALRAVERAFVRRVNQPGGALADEFRRVIAWTDAGLRVVAHHA